VKALFLKPPAGVAFKNIVRDFVYGCWCNGRRIGGMQMPPLNDLYAATHAREGGIAVLFVDASVEPARYDDLLNQRFSGIGAVVLMSSTQSFRQDAVVLRAIKALNPDVKAILYGSHPTFMPEYCLQEDVVDYVVLREAEETIRRLLQAIVRGEGVDSITGIGYRTAGGQIRINALRPLMNLDDLPIPDRRLLPPGVTYFNPVVKRLPYATMQTSRGCPGRCIYCTSPSFYGNKYRLRSVPRVIEELHAIEGLGYREVFFRDETFTVGRDRVREICEAILSEGIDLKWIANGRVDMVDEQTMRLMKRAGCHMLKFGVETGDEEILKVYRKGATCDQAREAFRAARAVGLSTHAHIIFGGPGETPRTIERTMEFVKAIRPTMASFGILTPYPGTRLFEMVAEKRPEIRDGSESNMENLHVEGFYSEDICQMSGAALSRAVVRAYRQFYLRPLYLIGRVLSSRSLEELMIQTIAGLNVFQFALTGRK
jgi:anaerobic magnesium-protoporphyrin IX monomethyl ester cyclase